MNHIKPIEELYRKYFNELPERIHKELGHFNLLEMHTPSQKKANQPHPISTRDYYKIMLVKGSCHVHFADGTVEVKKQALFFSSPQTPSTCEFVKEIGMLNFRSQLFDIRTRHMSIFRQLC